MDDDAIRVLLSRLARPHASGGKVIERAAMLAEGADFPELIAWIDAHHGEPESVAPASSAGGPWTPGSPGIPAWCSWTATPSG